jgi:hypothetical protein
MFFANLVVTTPFMVKEDTCTLHETDPEDIGDVLMQLQQSFNLSLPRNAFAAVKTFDDICDVYTSNITASQVNDCSSQQAFIKSGMPSRMCAALIKNLLRQAPCWRTFSRAAADCQMS